MPEGSNEQATHLAEPTPQDKLAEKIGDAAFQFTEEQAEVLDIPAMHEKFAEWQEAGHLESSAFIEELKKIVNAKIDPDAATGVATAARAQQEATPVISGRRERVPLKDRLKKLKLGKGAVASTLAFGMIAAGAGSVIGAIELTKDRPGVEYALANVDGRLVDQGATEADMVKFFDIGPSTHEQTKETPETGDDFNFRPTREALFNYNGSEESIQMVIDDMSDMFRRDVRIQAAWASALNVEGAPRIPATNDLQNPQVYYDYHQALYAYTDKLARDIKERTKAYNAQMKSLQDGNWAAKIYEADTDQVSVGHDGNRVTIAKHVGDRGREAQYVVAKTKNAAGEEETVMIKLDCGQWMRVTYDQVNIPQPVILDQPRPVAQPVVTETPRTDTPRVTVTVNPPRTTTPWTPPPTYVEPKNPAYIPPVPEQVAGPAPVATWEPPPPPPPPAYHPPSPTFQLPDLSGIFAPGSRQSTNVWQRGQSGSNGSAPRIPRNSQTNPGGGSGINNGMIGG